MKEKYKARWLLYVWHTFTGCPKDECVDADIPHYVLCRCGHYISLSDFY